MQTNSRLRLNSSNALQDEDKYNSREYIHAGQPCWTQEEEELYAGFFEERFKANNKRLEQEIFSNFPHTNFQHNIMSQPQHEEAYKYEQRLNELKRQSAEMGSKSITSMEKRKPSLSVQELVNKLPNPDPAPLVDRQQAEIELSFIRAAITLAQGSNDIGAEVTIAGITVGVSVNSRLIPVLEAEAQEIEKFLMGQPNNWE